MHTLFLGEAYLCKTTGVTNVIILLLDLQTIIKEDLFSFLYSMDVYKNSIHAVICLYTLGNNNNCWANGASHDVR